jgi:tetratricopeptide (TPR) repeat protein
MAGSPGLEPVNQSINAWQRLVGPFFASGWCQFDNPPIGPEKIGYYAATLSVTARGEKYGRLARCLIWCEADTRTYCPHWLDWYREGAQAFPEDERSVFYVGALCYHGIFKNAEYAEKILARLLQPKWDSSLYWARFGMPRYRVLLQLATLYAEQREPITPERIEIVESALDREDDGLVDRKLLASYLARAYRHENRMDATADIVYRFVFQQDPDDQENNRFLAAMYSVRQRADASACAVFARMAAQLDAVGEKAEADEWTLRLARTYTALGRTDEGTLAAFERAKGMMPEDREIRAAYLAALVRRDPRTIKEAALTLLEQAVRDEAGLLPLFEKHRWSWGLVVRALALIYDQRGRYDDAAASVYARATEWVPEERGLWIVYGRALARREDYSEAATDVYEKAIRTSQPDESVSLALARAYVVNNAYDGPRRPQALLLWETLFRQGQHWPEMVAALAQAYTGEERVNDIAIALWTQAVNADDKNGLLRLRLAQEWKMRGELETALKYYREAARLLPKEFIAQFEAAQLLMEYLSDYSGAIRLLQKAVKLPAGSRHLMAHFYLGEALLARDKRDEAKEVFQTNVDEIDANHTKTLLHLAKLNLKYEEQGVQKAEALYEQALTLDPDLPETYRKMAELYREKGQTEEEQVALEKYLSLSQPDADKYQQLADLYIRRGDFVRAETALRQVIALGKGDKKLYTLLGEVLVQARAQAKAA